MNAPPLEGAHAVAGFGYAPPVVGVFGREGASMLLVTVEGARSGGIEHEEGGAKKHDNRVAMLPSPWVPGAVSGPRWAPVGPMR